MADDITFYDEIEAYPGFLSYAPGDMVDLHVSCRSDAFDVRIERWGGDRQVVWEADSIPGQFHPAPDNADSQGCRWPATLSLAVPEEWRSGFYLVTLTAIGAPEGRNVAHAGFAVRSATPTASTLLVLSTNTWNAYNTWGGASLYTGGKQVSFRRPFGRGFLSRVPTERDDRKARPTRWGEEADPSGAIYQGYRNVHGYAGFVGSSGWYTFERRFVEWAEREGRSFDFAVSADLEDGNVDLSAYKLVLSVGHDEYWSAPQRRAVETYVESGGHLASFSGNTMFWQVRLEDGDGRPGNDVMVCHKYSAHETDPVMSTAREREMSGMWADPVVGQPETALLGGGSAWGLYHRFGQATPRGAGGFTVYRNTHWLFEGTGLRYGDVFGSDYGVVGYETLGCRLQFDEYQLPISAGGDGTPEDMEIVAFTPSSNLGVGEYPASISALSDQGDLEFVASRLFGEVNEDSLARVRHGNAIMAVVRPFGTSGGEVVTIGTTDWTFGLDVAHRGADPDVAQITANVLDRYAPA